VQYISHEARGPLGVASMGLELHMQDMVAMDNRISDHKPPSAAEKVAWVKETIARVDEIADACILAHNTLSDMLTVDKIENGMADMEMVPLLILPFVGSIVKAFSIQVCAVRLVVGANYTRTQCSLVCPSYCCCRPATRTSSLSTTWGHSWMWPTSTSW
jgi:signal transduction histidine kinase